MLDFVIFIILIIGFFIGLRRGFILQVIHLTGFIVAFIAAYLYYDDLAPKLKLWIPYPAIGDSSSPISLLFDSENLEDVYYRAIAFFVVFISVKVIMQLIGSMLDFVAHLPILRQLNVWAGGFLGLIEVYLIMFILLYLAALVPIQHIQEPMQHSFMAKTIVNHTPLFSQQIKDWWFEYMSV